MNRENCGGTVLASVLLCNDAPVVSGLSSDYRRYSSVSASVVHLDDDD